MTVEGIELIEGVCVGTVLGIFCEIPKVVDGNIKGGEIVVDFFSFFPSICPSKNSLFPSVDSWPSDDFDISFLFPFTSDVDTET